MLTLAEAPLEPEHVPGDRVLATLDASAFTAPLWTPTPSPPAEAVTKAERQEPPLELVLLAITNDGDQRLAALYDKRLNRVFLAQVGDTLATPEAVVVSAITDSAVELKYGERRSRLALRKDES